MRMVQIQNLLEQAHEEEKFMRKEQVAELKRSWEGEIAARKALPSDNYILDVDACGPASAQNFGG